MRRLAPYSGDKIEWNFTPHVEQFSPAYHNQPKIATKKTRFKNESFLSPSFLKEGWGGFIKSPLIPLLQRGE